MISLFMEGILAKVLKVRVLSLRHWCEAEQMSLRGSGQRLTVSDFSARGL